MLYRLKRGRHTRYINGARKVFEAGQTFEPTEAELKAFGDRLEPAIILPPDAGNAKPEGPDEELKELRARAKELGVKNTGNMGKEKLLKEIAEAEQEAELKALREEADAPGIEDAANMDAEALKVEIEAKKGQL